MLTIGFEREYFERSNRTQELEIVPKALRNYADECGWLVEIRTKPVRLSIHDASDDLRRAIFEITLAEDHLEAEVVSVNCILHRSDWEKIPKSMRLSARREYAKGLISYRNLYDEKYLMGKGDLQPAGLHISFKNEQSRLVNPTTKEEFKYCPLWDFSMLFRALDKEFDEEIKASKRRRGSYELKGDSRIEYRSLPATISNERLYAGLLVVFFNNDIRRLF